MKDAFDLPTGRRIGWQCHLALNRPTIDQGQQGWWPLLFDSGTLSWVTGRRDVA